MGYVARVPANMSELYDNLTKIYENKSHIKGVKTDESANHICVDLDWAAHKFGGEAGKDFYIPIKRGKLREAYELVNKLLIGQHGPSRSEAQELYDMIDPHGK